MIQISRATKTSPDPIQTADQSFWETLVNCNEPIAFDARRTLTRQFIADHQLVLEESTDVIVQAAPSFRVLLQQAQTDNSISTRSIIKGVLTGLPEEVRKLYKNVLEGGNSESNWQSKVACWSFKVLKDKDQDSVVQLKARSKVPYVLHTHVDVPFCLSAFSEPTDFELALANSHDALEEGKVFIHDDSSGHYENLDMKRIKELFQTEKIGVHIADGITALTETPADELPCLSKPAHIKIETIEIAKTFFEAETVYDQKWFDIFFINHTHVFGGLALQVNLAAKEAKSNNRESKATGILAVEIADRIADVCSMSSYYFQPEKYGNFAAAERVLCFTSRILNMMDKIEDASSVLTEKNKAKILRGLQLLAGVLSEQLIDCKNQLPPEDSYLLEPERVRNHHSLMKAVQDKADERLLPFIQEKLRSKALDGAF
jgi:hypothetical protein